MNGARPSGMLMTGAIGGIFLALAWVIMLVVGVAAFSIVMGGGATNVSGDQATSMGIGMLAAILFGFIGYLLQAFGFFGLQKVFGGANSVAGIFSLLIVLGMILVIVAAAATSVGIGQIATWVIMISFVGQLLLAGVAFMGAKGKASSGQGSLMIGGVCYLVAGLVLLVSIICAKAGINLGSIGNILGYVMIFGMLLGHILCAVVMIGQRKGGGAPAAAPAAPSA
jgi:hypothetical protein